MWKGAEDITADFEDVENQVSPVVSPAGSPTQEVISHIDIHVFFNTIDIR